jgi:NTE family protein
MRRLSALAVLAAALSAVVMPASADEIGGAGMAGSRPRICLVLSGGGARGVAHIGVLKVLEELRVPVDCVVGTSVGAIVGGAYASGLGIEQLEQQIRNTEWQSVLSDQPARPQRSVRSKEFDRQRLLGAEFGLHGGSLLLPHGAIVGQQLELFLQQMVGQVAELPSFDEMAIPYRAIATDIETGGMIVLDHGSVAAAMRASMSVPGVFAPQELEGHLLVDGGLVRKLGVDVARSMGADVVIAVNLGSPLLKRAEINSILGVSQQTINILMEQNVQRSLQELGPRDVLIQPELGDFGSTDFVHSATTIPLGEQAARRVADQLSPLALDAEGYVRYRAELVGPQSTHRFAHIRVATTGLRRVNPRSVEMVYRDAASARGDRKSLLAGVTALYATDDFQQVRMRVEETDGSRDLIIDPVEKSWGPNYLRFGLNLSTDFAGNSNFNVLADHRMTWLDSFGLEWRNQVSIGQLTRVATEFYQPLDTRRRFFIAPRAEWSQQIDDVFNGDDSIARYRNRRGGGGLDLGFRLATIGELRIGYEYTALRSTLTTGSPLFSNFQADTYGWRGRLTFDQLDDWVFPQSGYYANVDARLVRSATSEAEYDQLRAELRYALGGGRHSLVLGLVEASSLGTDVPFYDAFPLGGPASLGGYSEREWLVQGYTLGEIAYQFRLKSLGMIARSFNAGAAFQVADIRGRINGPEPAGVVYGSSAFLSTDTALGPIYLGIGVAEGGRYTFFFYLGKP